jgi:cell division protein ZapA
VAETTLQIAGRHYVVRCRDGEEAHLAHLASLIEGKARAAQANAPGLTEVRTLLFAALFLADEVNDLKREAANRQASLDLAPPPPPPGPIDDEPAIRAVEALADRIEKVTARLAAKAADA